MCLAKASKRNSLSYSERYIPLRNAERLLIPLFAAKRSRKELFSRNSGTRSRFTFKWSKVCLNNCLTNKR